MLSGWSSSASAPVPSPHADPVPCCPAPAPSAPGPPATTLKMKPCLLLLWITQVYTHSYYWWLMKFCLRVHANVCSRASNPDPSLICLINPVLKDFKQTILNLTICPLCWMKQCFHSGLSSFLPFNPAKCSSPRVYPFLPVSPWYIAVILFVLHSWHSIL